jgi:hypothetical protein
MPFHSHMVSVRRLHRNAVRKLDTISFSRFADKSAEYGSMCHISLTGISETSKTPRNTSLFLDVEGEIYSRPCVYACSSDQIHVQINPFMIGAQGQIWESFKGNEELERSGRSFFYLATRLRSRASNLRFLSRCRGQSGQTVAGHKLPA